MTKFSQTVMNLLVEVQVCLERAAKEEELLGQVTPDTLELLREGAGLLDKAVDSIGDRYEQCHVSGENVSFHDCIDLIRSIMEVRRAMGVAIQEADCKLSLIDSELELLSQLGQLGVFCEELGKLEDPRG